MSQHLTAATVTSKRSSRLTGHITVPGDGVMSPLAVILAGLSSGESVLSGLPSAAEVARTADAMRSLGARVEGVEGVDGVWTIEGTGSGALLEPLAALDLADADLACRLLAGLLSAYDFESRFAGDASRSMNDVLAPLRKMGAQITAADDDHLPLTLRAARSPVPISWRLETVNPGIKAAVLLAGLNTPGVTSVSEPKAQPDSAERLLAAFGAGLKVADHGDDTRTIGIEGRKPMVGQALHLPGDALAAAFLLIAGSLVPGSDLVVGNVPMGEAQKAFLDVLREMGADIEVRKTYPSAFGEAADLQVRAAPLKGTNLPADRAAAIRAELPLLLVATALAEGQSRIAVAVADLPTDVMPGLQRLGIECTQEAATVVVHGRPGGEGYGSADGHALSPSADVRTDLAFLLLGLVAEYGVTIDSASLIAKRVPQFFDAMAGLGAAIEEV